MRYEPHKYQAFATEFIETHKQACLMLDMGLGKTVCTLTAIHNLKYDWFDVRKVLVIAPLRVARDTWPAEIEKWDHLKDLTYSVCIGTLAERTAALKKKADVYLINRENVSWLIEDSGFSFDFDMVVIDELSSFKSGKAKRFKSLMQVRPKVSRVVGLTGTPSTNGLMDLWAEYRLLDLGQRLGRFITRYRDAFFVPDKRNQQIIFSYKPREGAEEEIYRMVSDITISMKSVDYLDMPELITNYVPVELSSAEQKVYRDLKQNMVLELGEEEIDAVNAAALSNKLLQLANGAVYNEDRDVLEFHSRKLDALEDLIEAANGKPVLIAYWFRHDLKRIQKRFPEAKELKSSQDIRDWNEGRIPVALMHPQSAGHGLNLQAGGSTLIWFGLTWSLELYQQTNARLWRQGQTSTVIIHHIICRNTIDELVISALEKKDNIQSALIDAVKANLKEE